MRHDRAVLFILAGLRHASLVDPDAGGSAATTAPDEMSVSGHRRPTPHQCSYCQRPVASGQLSVSKLVVPVWVPPEYDLPVYNTLALHGVANVVVCRSLVPCLVFT